jgi:hypothetical protein
MQRAEHLCRAGCITNKPSPTSQQRFSFEWMIPWSISNRFLSILFSGTTAINGIRKQRQKKKATLAGEFGAPRAILRSLLGIKQCRQLRVSTNGENNGHTQNAGPKLIT